MSETWGAVLKACRQRMGRRKGRSDGSTGTFAMPEIRREAWPEHFATVSAGRGVAPEATRGNANFKSPLRPCSADTHQETTSS